MSIAVADRITRGTNNTAEFAVVWEGDLKLSNILVTDQAERDAIPEWKRMSYMQVRYITGEVFELGLDTTVAGQVWTEVTPDVLPDNVVTEDEIFDIDGYIKADLVRNIFLNDQFVVDSEAEMLALTTVTGNFVIRTDTSAIFVKLNNDDPATLADFSEITYPGAVLSVNGDVGAVVITLDDLITEETSVFNDAVAASPSITSIDASIVTLTNDLDALELIVDGIVASTGTINGSTGALDNAVLRANGTGGVTLQASPVVISDTGDLRLGVAGVTASTARIIEARGIEPDISLLFLAQGDGELIFSTAGNVTISGEVISIATDTLEIGNTADAGATVIKIFEDTPGTNFIGITVPSSIAADVTYVLPVAPTSNGQTLKGNTDGTLYWE